MYNVLGGFLWVWSMLLGGYNLGSYIHNFEKNIHYVIVVVIILSFAPVGVHWVKSRKEKFS
jgi:membrane-associated protein